jgi:hypothetical protein
VRAGQLFKIRATTDDPDNTGLQDDIQVLLKILDKEKGAM